MKTITIGELIREKKIDLKSNTLIQDCRDYAEKNNIDILYLYTPKI